MGDRQTLHEAGQDLNKALDDLGDALLDTWPGRMMQSHPWPIAIGCGIILIGIPVLALIGVIETHE